MGWHIFKLQVCVFEPTSFKTDRAIGIFMFANVDLLWRPS